MRFLLFVLTCISTNLFAAQEVCINEAQRHIEADMPVDSYEWYFVDIDNLQTQASLIFPRELNGATFFQVLVQKEENSVYEYAYPLEARDHPIATGALQIEFIIGIDQLSEVVIKIEYIELPFLECSDSRSYAYLVKPS